MIFTRWHDGRLSKAEKQIVTRFNKISLEHAHAFRSELGKIVTENAAKGLLQSGFTVKRSYAALQTHLDATVDHCLQLISNKTLHAGNERKRLLSHVRDQVRHHQKHMNTQIEEVIFQRVGLGNDGKAAADHLAANCLQSALDRVDKYEDGLTAPRDERWHVRHPFLAGAIGAALTGIVGLLLAVLAKGFD